MSCHGCSHVELALEFSAAPVLPLFSSAAEPPSSSITAPRNLPQRRLVLADSAEATRSSVVAGTLSKSETLFQFQLTALQFFISNVFRVQSNGSL